MRGSPNSNRIETPLGSKTRGGGFAAPLPIKHLFWGKEVDIVFDQAKWLNPPKEYRVKPIVHHWQDDYVTQLDAIEDFGFGGVVTNPDIEGKPENYRKDCQKLKEIIAELKKRNLPWFLYDEKGFPSGWGFGLTVKGHPELEAKGLYMHRHKAYHCEKFSYHIDDDSDKIIWAMVYPSTMRRTEEGFPVQMLDYNHMRAVPFQERFLQVEMEPQDTLFIFAVRTAQEGAQVANTPAVGPYMNIMDPRAVRRFLDIAYEPLAEEAPEVYAGAFGVFTDEPSLMVRHMTPYQNWSFALVPWCDGILDRYAQEYGQRLEPLLHYLFEGSLEAAPERIRYHSLVGKIIGESYTKQINDWCIAHGTQLSGHYLGEESIHGNVLEYGSYIEVLQNAGYPGMDILDCYPEVYHYNSAKIPQIAVRKKGTNGMMAEICPVNHISQFSQDPVNNMSGIMGLLYLGGVRMTNSYFFPNLEEYSPQKLKGVTGLLHRQDARSFNEYVGRLGYMLDGLANSCTTFLYYGIEDMQGKYLPSYTAMGFVGDVDLSTIPLVNAVYENGHDFYYADRDDLVTAAAQEGQPKIAGNLVKTIIIPKMDILYEDSYQALLKLSVRGTKVLFLEQIPSHDAKSSYPIQTRNHFTPVSLSEILDWLDQEDSDFSPQAPGCTLIKGKFMKENRELWMVLNNSRKDASVKLVHRNGFHGKVYQPVDGTVFPIKSGDSICIPMLRGVFIWFDE